tara:strand:+ start:3350 stop:4318 length:969 start_codon:yes stop_codon:yes gene_type:complete
MTIIKIPEYAKRHHWWHHSNPKDRSKSYFDKSFVRPLLAQAKINIENDIKHDLSQHILDSFQYSDSAVMCAGRIVQKSVDKMLIDGDAYPIVGLLADNEFDKYIPRDWDQGRDQAQKEAIAPLLRSVILNAFQGMQEALELTQEPCSGETDLLNKLPGCDLPYYTKPDYNRRIELKTKWVNNKDGFPSLLKTTNEASIKSLPKTLSGIFEKSWVSQVAGYYALNDGELPVIVVANANGHEIFHAENCEQLTPDFLDFVISQTIDFCQVTELHLKKTSTPMELCQLIDAPDFNSIFWNEKPSFKALAMDLFANRRDIKKWQIL